LMVDVAGEQVPMAMARGLATHPDAARRRAAYEGELAAWESASVPLAAALNGAKGELAVLNRRRGYRDDLEPNLRANNVDRSTVDAMTDAVVASLPEFRRYFRAKGRLLGHEGGLPWWDLFAPVGGEPEVSWDDATSLVLGAFGGYSDDLAGLATRAFSEQWVDAEIREGKRGGAYCAPVDKDVSRVMMNFDGSHDSVSTLAHELGHAFHNVALADRTPLQRRLPMALAETASIFCETLLFESSVHEADGRDARLAILDTYLVGASQVVVDIHSRFLFETELCLRRRRTSVSVPELNATMLDAQERAYGDGLQSAHRHPYMWAVKPHYFTPFYNWPYTFGLLFGVGLYAKYSEDPERFRAGYDELLSGTGMADAAALTGEFGFDVHDVAFWAQSLDVIRRHIDDYERLVETTS
ncbi:MAG: M3 family metallopeptidase, partial [Acidimicrobiia bacterium]